MVFWKFITSIKMEYRTIQKQTIMLKKEDGTEDVRIQRKKGEELISLEDIQRSCSKRKMILTKCTARTASHNKLVERLRKKLANKK